eukprot:2938842-Pleurochrysis_carterae.AAC.2
MPRTWEKHSRNAHTKRNDATRTHETQPPNASMQRTRVPARAPNAPWPRAALRGAVPQRRA